MFNQEAQRRIRQIQRARGSAAYIRKQNEGYYRNKAAEQEARLLEQRELQEKQKKVLEGPPKPQGKDTLDEQLEILLKADPKPGNNGIFTEADEYETRPLSANQLDNMLKAKFELPLNGAPDILPQTDIDNAVRGENSSGDDWQPASQEEMDALKAGAEPVDDEPTMIVVGPAEPPKKRNSKKGK